MKIRKGFVSNSSSSSFVVHMDDISEDQLRSLLVICAAPIGVYQDTWDIEIDNRKISGYTSIDNGRDEHGLQAWMIQQKFPMDKISWKENR